jgi:methionyl-tRNA synthetase
VSNNIANYYEDREFGKAMREIMAQADLVNEYIANQEPWKLNKVEGERQRVQDICSLGINLFRIILVYLKPVLPATAEAGEAFLNDTLSWNSINQPLLNHKINPFKPIMQRVEKDKVEAMVAASKEETNSVNKL